MRPSAVSRKFQQQRLHPPTPIDEATPTGTTPPSIIRRVRDDSSDDEATSSCHGYHFVPHEVPHPQTGTKTQVIGLEIVKDEPIQSNKKSKENH